jgi:hypothetical protein
VRLRTRTTTKGKEATNDHQFEEHCVWDADAAYAVHTPVEVFLLGEHRTDTPYLASFFGSGQLAVPFPLFGDVRLAAF